MPASAWPEWQEVLLPGLGFEKCKELSGDMVNGTANQKIRPGEDFLSEDHLTFYNNRNSVAWIRHENGTVLKLAREVLSFCEFIISYHVTSMDKLRECATIDYVLNIN